MKEWINMATDHAEVLLRKSQDPPLGGSVRDCRSSGFEVRKSGPFTLLVLMIGAVFQKLPRISRKIHGSAAGCSFHHAQLVRVHAFEIDHFWRKHAILGAFTIWKLIVTSDPMLRSSRWNRPCERDRGQKSSVENVFYMTHFLSFKPSNLQWRNRVIFVKFSTMNRAFFSTWYRKSCILKV